MFGHFSTLCMRGFEVVTLNISNLHGFDLPKLHTSFEHICSQNYISMSANIYLFKVDNINTRKRCEICSKLRIKTPERCHWHRSGVFILNFEHISHFFLDVILLFLLLTLNIFHIFFCCFYCWLWTSKC